jgi:hypothetical protein
MRSPNAAFGPLASPRRKRRFVFLKGAFALLAAVFGVLVGFRLTFFASVEGKTGTPHSREALFALLQPVTLTNCELQRFGEAHDGGYLMCANLLQDVQAGYSYGISGYDQWGCDVSTRRKVPVHQYDCFNTTVPACPTGTTNFHAECVGDVSTAKDGRRFDTIADQLQKNGDGSKRIVLKIDVEGAEWSSFLAAPDETLSQIDQLAVEFHGIEDPRSLAVVQRLKKFFEVAHIHYNNASCLDAMAPFPAWAYEVLFVSKRLAVVDPSRKPPALHPLDAKNIPFYRDCQATP